MQSMSVFVSGLPKTKEQYSRITMCLCGDGSDAQIEAWVYNLYYIRKWLIDSWETTVSRFGMTCGHVSASTKDPVYVIYALLVGCFVRN